MGKFEPKDFTAFKHHLLTFSRPTAPLPLKVVACVSGMFELKDFTAFKHHLRDFLVQTKQFASQDNAELFAEEVEKEVQAQKTTEQQRLAAVPGLLPPSQIALAEDMADA